MKYILEALLLGLSTGTYCTMYCAPILLPFLFGSEKLTPKWNSALTGIFLGGRFVTYVILGCVLGFAGMLVSEFFNPTYARHLSVIAYIVCGIVLLLNSLAGRFPFSSAKNGCACKKIKYAGNDFVTAALSGLGVGLHICPPFWTAVARSVGTGSGSLGLLYFVFFYLGTLPFFVPLLGIPFLAKMVPALHGKISHLMPESDRAALEITVINLYINAAICYENAGNVSSCRIWSHHALNLFLALPPDEENGDYLLARSWLLEKGLLQ